MVYTEQELKGFSIYKLRQIAHQVGVKSPTTKKSEELVNHILAIQSGEEEPYFPTKKLGRPLKENTYFEEKNIGFIMCADTSDISGKIIFRNSVLTRDLEEEFVKGYFIETMEKEYFIVNLDNPLMIQRVAYVPAKLVDRRRLRVGHYVKVQVMDRGENELPVAVAIVEIEGQQYKGFFNEQFEHKNICFDKDRYFSFPTGTVFYGDRVLFSGDKHSLVKVVLNLTNEVYNYCESIVLLGLNMTPEKINQLKNFSNVEMFYSLFSDNYETQYFIYKLAVNHAKRLAELGKRVIFIVANIDNLYDNLEMSEIDKNASLKSLYGLARNFSDVGSFTVIGTCSDEFYNKNKDFEDYIDMHIIKKDKTLELDNLRAKRDGIY